MKIFSEIYGAYFRTAAAVLSRDKISEKEIYRLISENAFSESGLFIPEKLIPDKSGFSPWGLLKRDGDGFSSVLRNRPARIMTTLRKRWLKALLSDPLFRTFMDDAELERLSRRLENVEPLYDRDFFRFFDRFSDGDDYSDEKYRENVKRLVRAVKEKEIMEITMRTPDRGGSARGGVRKGKYLPVRIEYSSKNDKLRLLCLRMQNVEPGRRCTVNLGRITRLRGTGVFYDRDTDIGEFFAKTRCRTPVTVEVSRERNAFERVMTEFASYEKQSELDPETGKCIVRIWYDAQDETELLIRLLSFGPVLEIRSPASVRREAAARVKRQYELLFGN